MGSGLCCRRPAIKISHVTESTVPDNSGPDYAQLTLTDTTIVKADFAYTVPAAEDWEQFNFATPFGWDGRSNILISWKNRDGTYAEDYGWIEDDRSLGNRSHRWAKDNDYPTMDSSHDAGRPNLKINSEGVPGHIH